MNSSTPKPPVSPYSNHNYKASEFTWSYLGVSENLGVPFWGPYNKDPTI